MHITLHLTQDCDLACTYCYREQRCGDMDFETAIRAIKTLTKDKEHCGIIFFGGEPLLKKELITAIHDWCETTAPHKYHYKITTNGLELDKAFLNEATNRGIHIALSVDGNEMAHDTHRLMPDGSGSFQLVNKRLISLLKAQPYAPIMMTVSPDTIEHYFDSVKWLQASGVNYLIASMDFSATWTMQDLKALRRQYKLLADWHFENYRAERKFYFSPLDKRIASAIFDKRPQSCQLGKRQISVGPDGSFYPCVQFVGHKGYKIGSIHDGLNQLRQCEIFHLNESDRPTCSGCALEKRCHNKCGCLNFQTTGNLQTLPAVLCEYERMIFPIADNLGNRLFKLRDPMFIQRHYNTNFPVLSFLEDLTT